MKSIKSRLLFYMLLITIIPLIAFLVYSLVFVSSEIVESEVDSNETKILWASQYLESVNDQLRDIVYSIHVEDSLLQKVDESNIDSLDIEDLLRSSLYANANLISQIEVYSSNSSRSVSIDFENGFNTSSVNYDDPLLLFGTNPVGVGFHNYDGDIYAIHSINEFNGQDTLGTIIIKLNNNVVDELSKIFGEDSSFLLMNHNTVVYGDSELDTTVLHEKIQEGTHNVITMEIESQKVWINQIRCQK